MGYIEKIDKTRVPRHVALIMDGNGRWAAKQGLERIFGHQRGVDSVRNCIEAAAEIGVEYITLYAFSTENWNRPKHEVDALMSIFVKSMKKETDSLNKNNVRVQFIGDLERLSENVRTEMREMSEKLSNNTGLTMVLAISYSSRWEIINAVKSLALDVKKEKIDPDNISQELFESYLATAKMPDPELMIRTSGESRISNFLLWQLAYTELYFTPKLWPDFGKEDFFEAICDYQQRERRFGKTSGQIKN